MEQLADSRAKNIDLSPCLDIKNNGLNFDLENNSVSTKKNNLKNDQEKIGQEKRGSIKYRDEEDNTKNLDSIKFDSLRINHSS